MNNDSRLIFEAYTLNGLATGKTVDDVAKKHGVLAKDIEAQIEKGTQVEHEHTGDEQTARKIAMDHVFEDPKYYDKLSKIEGKSENAEMPTKDFAKLKQHINKGPIQIKKPSKELPYTHKYMHDLAKQDPREGHKEENDEKQEEGDLMAHMKQQGMIAKDATTDTGKYGHTREEEEGIEKIHPSEKKYGEELKARQEMERKFREWLKNNPDKAKHYPQKRSEDEERRLDPKCWKGYHKQGTKLKNGVRVNNCVKNS